MGRRVIRAAAAFAIVSLLTACFGGAKARPGERLIGGGVTTVDVSYRAPAPSIQGELLENGERFDLSDYRGKVVVLNFWASWCGPCAREAPMLKSLSVELTAAGVVFVGIDIRDQRTSARRFQERYGITYVSVFDQPSATVLAFDGKLPANPPNTVILDRQGRVAARVLGETSASTLRPLIADVLAESAP